VDQGHGVGDELRDLLRFAWFVDRYACSLFVLLGVQVDVVYALWDRYGCPGGVWWQVLLS
jgi:hypothetical protein